MSSIYESLFLQITGLVGGIVIFILAIGLPDIDLIALELVGLVVLISVFFLLLSRNFLILLLRFLPSKNLKLTLDKNHFLPFHKSLGFSVLYLLPTLINGSAAGIISSGTLGVVQFREFVAIVAAYAIAGAIGTLAVFVPSGIGVREGIFVTILVIGGFSSIDAIVVSILARFLSTLSDFLVAGVFIFLSRVSQTSR
jgi:uncharacterized membrane protein YbhN (UPF0104 family)